MGDIDLGKSHTSENNYFYSKMDLQKNVDLTYKDKSYRKFDHQKKLVIFSKKGCPYWEM